MIRVCSRAKLKLTKPQPAIARENHYEKISRHPTDHKPSNQHRVQEAHKCSMPGAMSRNKRLQPTQRTPSPRPLATPGASPMALLALQCHKGRYEVAGDISPLSKHRS
jgi:hypothetical protein